MVTVELDVFELANVIRNNYNYNYSEALAISEYVEVEYTREVNLNELINSIVVYSDYKFTTTDKFLALSKKYDYFTASNGLTVVECS